MTRTPVVNSSRPLLNWLLRRGSHTLAFQVRRTGSRYQVSILPAGEHRLVHTKRIRAGRNAFQLHAAWVAAFRDAGWTSVAYLQSEHVGLDHEFSIHSAAFLTTVAGASGSPFLSGNRVELLNNGDAFYPKMLAAIEGANVSITIEAYIYWAGEIGR